MLSWVGYEGPNISPLFKNIYMNIKDYECILQNKKEYQTLE